MNFPWYFMVMLWCILIFHQIGNAQEPIEVQYFAESEAKNSAVICARYSTMAYRLCQKIVFENNLSKAKGLADDAVFYLSKAQEFIKKSGDKGCDTCTTAANLLESAKSLLLKAETGLEAVQLSSDIGVAKSKAEDAMYAAGNALLEAYNASFYLQDGSNLVSDETLKAQLEKLDNAALSLLIEKANNKQTLRIALEIINERKIIGLYTDNEQEDATSPFNEGPPPNLLFRVQVGSYEIKVPTELLEKYMELGGVEQKKVDGITKYLIGSFDNYQAAKELQEKALEKGIPQAVIVGEVNDEFISDQEMAKRYDFPPN